MPPAGASGLPVQTASMGGDTSTKQILTESAAGCQTVVGSMHVVCKAQLIIDVLGAGALSTAHTWEAWSHVG